MTKMQTARPAPPPQANQRLTPSEVRQQKQMRAIANLDQFLLELQDYEDNWMNGARIVGTAYRAADDNYNATLEQQKAKDTLEYQIAFSLLTIALTGGLGWIGAAAVSAAESAAVDAKHVSVLKAMRLEPVLLGARDATVQGMAGEISSVAPLVWTPATDSTVSPNPQKFQNELEIKVTHLCRLVRHDIRMVRRRFVDLPLGAWDTYEAYPPTWDNFVLSDWKARADEFAGEDDLPDDAEWMARELERARWAKYVLNKQADIGEKVRDRLKGDLKVTAAVLPTSGVHQWEDNFMGAKQLLDWAKNYQVRKFTDEAKNPKGGGPDHQ